MNELLTINTTSLANKQLGTQLNKIKKAIDSGNNAQWTIAKAIRDIIEKKLFEEDFETEQNLANVLGMSRPNLNKMKNAAIYHDSIEELKPFTLNKVMEMLVIPKEDIVEFLDGYEVTASDTVKNVREAVSAWKDDNLTVDAPDDEAGKEVDAPDDEAGKEVDAPDDEAGKEVDAPDDEAGKEVDAPDDEAGKEVDAPDDLTKAKRIVDKLDATDLVALMTYIESRM